MPNFEDIIKDSAYKYLFEARVLNKPAFPLECKIEEEPVLQVWNGNKIYKFDKEKEKMNLKNIKVCVDGEYFYPSDVEYSEDYCNPGGVMRIICPVGFRPYNNIIPKKPDPKFPTIKNVIFNDPATIVFWSDDTKTVVKCENEQFDPEKGLAMAITKKVLGNTGHYFETIKKWTRDWYVENVKNEVVKTDLDEQFKKVISEIEKYSYVEKEDNKNDPTTKTGKV